MATQSEKMQMLSELNEDEFRTGVLVHLLRKMGFKRVRVRHGPDEYGKDITFCESSTLGDTYTAVVAKVGNISGGASGSNNLSIVENQVKMAFEMPIPDVEEKREFHVNRVIVWTTGNISRNARDRIMHARGDKFRDVRFKDGSATIDLLDEHYPAYFSIRDPYVSEYYTAAKVYYSRLEELRTLGGYSEQRLLPVIFVPPSLIDFEASHADLRSIREVGKSRKVCPFNDLLEIPEDTIVVGGAGSGKSTLLRRLLLSIIEENEQIPRRSPIPILVQFNKLNLTDDEGIEKAINAEYAFHFDMPEMAQDLGADLEDGSVIVLLDALDELETEERITRALDLVKEFKQRYPGTRTVLTSRLLDVLEQPNLLSGFRMFEIERLSPEQMAKFIENWFGQESPLGMRLIELVNEPLALRGLPATPLTLALVAVLYESGSKEVPANLTELCEKYVELALGRWDISKGMSLQFEWRVKEFILRRIRFC
jgi:hypothetical protein